MDVSVIIPTYKRPEKLERLLKSLINQKTKYHYEIIVIDNGNDQKTEKICKVFNVFYIKTESNIGPGEARNLGAKYANGRIFAFIDDDEFPESNWIESIVENIEDKDVIYGPIKTNIKPTYPFIHSFDRGEGILPSGNFAVKKDLFIKIRGFDGSLSFYGEDWYFMEKLKKLDIKPIYIENMIVYHPAVFKEWISMDFLKKSFKEFFYSLLLKKSIRSYPIERFINEIIIKNLLIITSVLVSLFIFDWKGLLIFYFIAFFYFSNKSYKIYKKLISNSISFPQYQLVLYAFLGVFNSIIQLLCFYAAFGYFIIIDKIFYVKSKKDNN